MKTLKLQFKHLRPEQGITFAHGSETPGLHSQIMTGEARVDSPHLCSGWWNRFTGQIWFDDQPITMYQKTQGGPVFVEKLICITEGGHNIIFQNVSVKIHNTKGFKKALEAKFTQAWSDNSEQAK